MTWFDLQASNRKFNKSWIQTRNQYKKVLSAYGLIKPKQNVCWCCAKKESSHGGVITNGSWDFRYKRGTHVVQQTDAFV